MQALGSAAGGRGTFTEMNQPAAIGGAHCSQIIQTLGASATARLFRLQPSLPESLGPEALVEKNPPASAGDTRETGLTPELGKSPGGRRGNPLQYSCLENVVDRGVWWATVHGVAESDMIEMTQHAQET